MQLIKRANGSTRGFITENGPQLTIHDPSGKVLGYYNKLQDKTYNASGALVGFGNQLTFLLKD